MIGIARVESHLGLHADARRRLLAARADAPPERRAILAVELAGGSFYEGRVTELRHWADLAVEATQDDAAAADRRRGAGRARRAVGRRSRRGGPLLDSATERLDAIADAGLGVPRDRVLRRDRAALSERFEEAASTTARALKLVARDRPGRAARDAPRRAHDGSLQLLELDAAATEAEATEDAARLQGEPHLVHFALWDSARSSTTREARLRRRPRRLRGKSPTALVEPSKLTRTAACDFAALDEDPQRALDGMLAAAGPLLEEADPTWQPRLLLRSCARRSRPASSTTPSAGPSGPRRARTR